MGTRLRSILPVPLLRVLPAGFPARRIGWCVRVLCGIVAVIWLLNAPGLAAKQKTPTTDTVSGLVTDTTEKEISGATVTLKDLQTGKTLAIYTEANGRYKFSDLDPHHDYEIQASFKGVDSEARQVSSLDTRRNLVLNLAIFTAENKDQAEAERLAALLHWGPGSAVAEIGAGEGQLTLAAAQRVGPTGHVFSTELDPKMLVNLKGLAAQQKVENITVVEAGEAQTNLPPECCDSIYMRYVYHHFTKPAQEDASLFQSLKPGGILAVIDFPPTKGASTPESSTEDVPHNEARHGITTQALVDQLSAAGFQLVTIPKDWPGQDFCVVFRKPPQ